MTKEAGLTRREFNRNLLLATLGLTLLPSCGSEGITRESGRNWERGELPGPGDVAVIENKPYLIRSNILYPIPNLGTYRRNTKFDQYDGRILTDYPQGFFDDYVFGVVPELATITDPFTGVKKTNRPLGGEMNIYLAGFMTSEGEVYNPARPETETFAHWLKMLEGNGWDRTLDNFFFTYGERVIRLPTDDYPVEYNAKQTAKFPEENIRHVIEFLDILKLNFPLVQFNLIAHSLGGLFAMAAAMEHWDAINSITLISSPVRGFKNSPDRLAAAKILKEFLASRGLGEEHVTDFLFDLWKNKRYQNNLDEFVEFFTKMGRKLVVILNEDDMIVPPESSRLKGAEEIKLRSIYKKKAVLIDVEKAKKDHGEGLVNQLTIARGAQRIGEDLTDAV